MAMKIQNWTGSADTFTFPVNAKSIDDQTQSNATFTNIDYQRHHILVSGGGIAPKNIILNGAFNGASKDSNYQDLSKHFTQTTLLKKLYFESNKFYLGVGSDIKQIQSGGRTNFVDYVANFRTIIGILLDDTEDTTGTNDGNARTFVTKVTGTVTNGSNPITISDNHGNQLTIPASSISTGNAIVFEFVKMVDSGDGVFISEYNYTTVAGTQINTVQVSDGFGILVIDPGENVSTITTANLTTAVVTYRDGWTA